MRLFICKQCGKKFKRYRNNHDYKFCSLSCSTTYMNKRRERKKGRYKRCDNCGKKIWVNNHKIKINSHFFCSKDCYLKFVTIPTDEIYCDNCGELIEKPSYRIRRSKHHFCNQDCYLEWNRGINHGRWVGGYSSDYGRGWKFIRKIVLYRDKECKNCGSKKRLEVHHIIPFSVNENNSLSNLITLCKSCHSSIGNLYWNGRRKDEYFKLINEIR